MDYAKDILKIEENLLSFASKVEEKNEEVLIGMCAPGPLFYYSDILKGASKFGKYVTEINEKEDDLVKELVQGKYDFIFLSKPFEKEGYLCKKIFKEELYISLPKDHFLSKMKDSLYFKDIDGV